MMDKIEITRIILDDGYYIDAIPSLDKEVTELWLHKSDIGSCLHMFGLANADFEKHQHNLADNVQEYIVQFQTEYE